MFEFIKRLAIFFDGTDAQPRQYCLIYFYFFDFWLTPNDFFSNLTNKNTSKSTKHAPSIASFYRIFVSFFRSNGLIDFFIIQLFLAFNIWNRHRFPNKISVYFEVFRILYSIHLLALPAQKCPIFQLNSWKKLPVCEFFDWVASRLNWDILIGQFG